MYTPTLSGLGERAHLPTPEVSLSTHIAHVVNVLLFEDLDAVTLAGNSSGGTVITGVADRVPERIRRIVYLDAFVPSDGQSTSDLVAPDRWAAMEQVLQSEGDGWPLRLPIGYPEGTEGLSIDTRVSLARIRVIGE